jgi:competence protein ComEC
MAISGLHVGLVAGFAFVMTRFIWSRAYKLTLIVASQKVAAIFSIMAALFYAALAGFAVPTQRALIMCSVVLIAVLFDRKILSKDVLVIALLLVILNDPFATLSQGFWLSFTAVAVIFYISNRIFSESKLSLLLTVQLSVFIGLSPLLFLFFNELSFTAPLVNIVAIPYVSFIVVPVVLLAGVLSEWQYLADPLFRFSEAIVEGLLHILSLAQAILPAYSFIQFPFYLILTLSLSIIWILAPKGWPYRWLGLTGVIPLFLFQPDRPDKGDAHVTILDVGQGQAIVVETAKHLLLFDSGPAYGERFNTGSAIVVPFIKSTGLKKIDGMIVSHQDSDHMGGYRAIESQFRIDHLYSPVEFPSGATHWQQCNKGIQWSWDDVKFEFLNSNLEDELIKKENNQACVLKVSTASTALLIPSDIEKEGEQVLLKGSGGLKADYLIAPHHGSKTSSTEAFINAVGPTWVFYSVGYRNRFNHPDPDVVYRYRKLGILDASTADNGAISIYISNKSSINTIEFERNLNNSWWRTQ